VKSPNKWLSWLEVRIPEIKGELRLAIGELSLHLCSNQRHCPSISLRSIHPHSRNYFCTLQTGSFLRDPWLRSWSSVPGSQILEATLILALLNYSLSKSERKPLLWICTSCLLLLDGLCRHPLQWRLAHFRYSRDWLLLRKSKEPQQGRCSVSLISLIKAVFSVSCSLLLF
jgi:hypothetical protein